MPLRHLKFHHLGLAVKQDEDALRMLSALGYEIGEKVIDPQQNVYVRLCTSPAAPAVEIVQPGNGVGPLDKILDKNSSMIYHSCYETPDLGTTLAAFERAGLRCLPLVPRRPAVLFGGRHVSFYNVQNYGIIELLEDA